MQALGCDFYAFSGHKMFGPTGIGVLYGTSAMLESMPPYQSGGDMIRSVSFERTVYNVPPVPIRSGHAGHRRRRRARGGDWLPHRNRIRPDRRASSSELLEYATGALSQVPGVRVIGTAAERAGVLSFVVDGVHPHDVGTVLDREGVAIRTGHHCCQPLMDRLGVPATARASLALYNNHDDIDALLAALHTVHELFR